MSEISYQQNLHPPNTTRHSKAKQRNAKKSKVERKTGRSRSVTLFADGRTHARTHGHTRQTPPRIEHHFSSIMHRRPGNFWTRVEQILTRIKGTQNDQYICPQRKLSPALILNLQIEHREISQDSHVREYRWIVASVWHWLLR